MQNDGINGVRDHGVEIDHAQGASIVKWQKHASHLQRHHDPLLREVFHPGTSSPPFVLDISFEDLTSLARFDRNTQRCPQKHFLCGAHVRNPTSRQQNCSQRARPTSMWGHGKCRKDIYLVNLSHYSSTPAPQNGETPLEG